MAQATPVWRQSLRRAAMRFSDKTVTELKELVGGLDDDALKRLTRDKREGVRALAQVEKRKRLAVQAEAARLRGMLSYESELWARGVVHVAGTDEVGAGPLAGPVVAGAVILPPGTSIDRIDDSKQLDEATRNELAIEIRARAVCFAVAACSVEEIDRLNIYHASCEAMRRALSALSVAPAHVLIDAKKLAGLTMSQTPIIKGDQKSQSIAAASILAKVERDRIMTELGATYPGWGFESHKGYATPEHLARLAEKGASPVHRTSYAPVKAVLEPKGAAAPAAQLRLF